jgi:hypothetical protein
MDPRCIKSFSDHLLLGGTVVAVGCSAALWLPAAVTLPLTAVVWCRVAWIEDRIERVLSARADDVLGHLRRKAQMTAAFGWALVAGVLLTLIAPITFAIGMFALCLALRQADYLALGAARATTASLYRAHVTPHDGTATAVHRRPD